MFTTSMLHRARVAAGALFGVLLTASAARAQNAIITGKVVNEGGQALEFANVYINELTVSYTHLTLPTNREV